MRGLRLGLSLTGGAAAFNPASLSPLAWYDVSDLSTLFQDSAGTTPVTADGDPVGLIQDKSGNARHWTAAGGARPLYQVDGNGKPYLLLDGVDDGFFYGGNPGFPAAADVVWAFHNSSGATTYLPIDNAATNFIHLAQSGSAGLTSGGSGTPADFVNGVAVSPATRDGLFVAIGSAAPKVIEAQGADLSAWTTNLRFGLTAGAIPGGRFYGLIIVPAQSAGNRAALRTYMGAKAGLTL